MLKELWKFITNLGIHEQMSVFDEKAVKLMNQLSFIMVLWFSALTIFGLVKFDLFGFYLALANVILFSGVLFINNYGNTSVSKNYFMIFGLIMVTFVNLAFHRSNFPAVQFITTAIFPVMLFRNNRIVLGYIVANFFLFLFAMYYQQNYAPLMSASINSSFQSQYYSVMIIMTVAFLIAFFFRNLGDDLERKLVQKNSYLNDLIEKMKTLQEQMINSEKMASLGQLTAGIAHEINNPINFVSSNVSPLKADLVELKELCKKYKHLHTSADPATDLRDVESFSATIDPEFLYQEIETLINGIEEGANRTKQIVLGLRSFSRVDEDEFKKTNLEEGLESTLMLLKNKLKNRIKVHKNYDSLPDVECIPGKINQVFMNILNNAAEAIPDKGNIYLSTSLYANGKKVIIKIKDDGPGMNEGVKRRVFDPFFTTKEIGKGTGLGLSISYGIIEKHNGKIEVESNPGKGSEFIIILPVEQT